MNKAGWNNPPPPGTEYEFADEISHSLDSGRSSTSVIDQRHRQIVTKYTASGSPTFQEERYLVVEKSRYSRSPDKRRRHRRSRSYSRRSRSHSRERHRRSRSRSRRRRKRYSSSRSRSRSPSSGRRTKHRKHAHHRSRSRSRARRKKSRRSRSRSASRSHSRSRSYRSDRDNKRSPKLHYADERSDARYIEFTGDNREEEDMKLDPENPEEDDSDDQDDESDQNPIPFKNDGSFLEMFKKMQEEQKANEQSVQESTVKKPVLPCFGKRRGGKVLKTGIVAKVKNPDEEGENPQDAWSIYMQEVRKYKEVHCDDDSKTRPLVK